MSSSQGSHPQGYTLIVGTGVTGLSVLRHLYGREAVEVVDSRAVPPHLDTLREEFPDVPVHTGPFEAERFVRARRIIVSPGIALAEPSLVQAREAGIEIRGDIDLFAEQVSAPVVGITGSNGKSTVTMLLTGMAKQAGRDAVAGGNIGTPVLELVATTHDLYVLELSSFQLETLNHLDLAAAAVLNISEDHMDRYTDLAAYVSSKQSIFRDAACAVVNRDDERTGTARSAKRVIGFTLSRPAPGDYGVCRHDGEAWLCRCPEQDADAGEDDLLLPVAALRIRGMHNVANALAALALGEAIGLPMEAMRTAVRNFSGLPHRTEWVAEINGVAWFNDSKGTNVGATLAAIRGLPGQHVLIAGGRGKGADFSPLRDIAADRLRAVVLIGEDAALIARALGDEVPVYFARSMQQAVQMAADTARAGENVLLSPACASFDMFDNFEQRGEVFMQRVQELQA